MSSIKIVFVATFLITQIWQKMNIDLTHNLHLFTEASNAKYFLYLNRQGLFYLNIHKA